ncbi:MAG: formin-like protein 18 [Desulfovibrionales bacterium]|jgi:hypothetical protein|nr:formin-like protein 18 [Desulfovibrionales bacterium]
MGRVLQIRVMAYTYSEEEVRKAWPVLWAWAFEETRPGFPHDMRGVLELVRALDDLYQFGDIPKSLHTVLKTFLPGVLKGVQDLQQSLADWDPQSANQASDYIEDALHELNKQASYPD